MREAIAQFLHWLQSLFEEKPKPVELPPEFGNETTVSQWQLGKFRCSGALPYGVRRGYFYVLSCEQVRTVRRRTPAEIRWAKENAKSMVPTHRFLLTYQAPAVKNGRVTLGQPITVFCIERNCYQKKRPATSADWIACGEIAPALRDRVTEICKSSPTETIYQIKGKILKEGEKASKPIQMKTFETTNSNRLELVAIEGTSKKWEKFIDELLKRFEKAQ